jgi:hypothetical protein
MRDQKSGKIIKIFRFPNLLLYKNRVSVITHPQSKSKLTITLNASILTGILTNPRRKEDKWHNMEQAIYQTDKDMIYDQDLFRRRALLAALFKTLPTYGTAEFWRRIEESQSKC